MRARCRIRIRVRRERTIPRVPSPVRLGFLADSKTLRGCSKTCTQQPLAIGPGRAFTGMPVSKRAFQPDDVRRKSR